VASVRHFSVWLGCEEPFSWVVVCFIRMGKMTHDPELLCDLKKVISDRDSEIISQRQCIIYQQHVIERLLRLLCSAHESVCSLQCSSTWQYSNGQPHCDLCNEILDELNHLSSDGN
jgi:hypothetical protein